jgi:hypothetical protein
MDPYRTLGVPRGCTREELKAAFRARARYAHPDRGGKVTSFIQLRAAFEQIMADLDRRPRLGPDIPRPARAPRSEGAASPLHTAASRGGAMRAEEPATKCAAEPSDPEVARDAGAEGVRRDPLPEHRKLRRRERLRRRLVIAILSIPVFWPALNLYRLMSWSPADGPLRDAVQQMTADFVRVFLGAAGVSLAVFLLWVRDEVCDR